MKFAALENLSKKEISQTLKEVAGVSFTLSTKFVRESQYNFFEKILPKIAKAGFKEAGEDRGNFGVTKFFKKINN